MKVGELVKINRKFVQDYGLIIDIFDIQNIQKIKIRFFDGTEEIHHASSIKIIPHTA